MFIRSLMVQLYAYIKRPLPVMSICSSVVYCSVPACLRLKVMQNWDRMCWGLSPLSCVPRCVCELISASVSPTACSPVSVPLEHAEEACLRDLVFSDASACEPDRGQFLTISGPHKTSVWRVWRLACLVEEPYVTNRSVKFFFCWHFHDFQHPW